MLKYLDKDNQCAIYVGEQLTYDTYFKLLRLELGLGKRTFDDSEERRPVLLLG